MVTKLLWQQQEIEEKIILYETLIGKKTSNLRDNSRTIAEFIREAEMLCRTENE